MKDEVSDDRVWKALKKILLGPSFEVHVGILSDVPHDDTGISIAEVGAAHEFGTDTIPERSWLRKTLADQQEPMVEFINALVQKTMETQGKFTKEQAMNALGLWAVNEIKKTITEERVSPRLEESEAGLRTIQRKGSSVTLVDTGQLLNAITHKVIKT